MSPAGRRAPARRRSGAYRGPTSGSTSAADPAATTRPSATAMRLDPAEARSTGQRCDPARGRRGPRAGPASRRVTPSRDRRTAPAAPRRPGRRRGPPPAPPAPSAPSGSPPGSRPARAHCAPPPGNAYAVPTRPDGARVACTTGMPARHRPDAAASSSGEVLPEPVASTTTPRAPAATTPSRIEASIDTTAVMSGTGSAAPSAPGTRRRPARRRADDHAPLATPRPAARS